MSKSYWTEDEDKLLTRLVTGGVAWAEISKEINISYGACFKRWRKIDPSFKSGYWDKEEDFSLILWLFSNLESRIASQNDLWANRRRSDVIKRTEFLKKQFIEKMFPEGIEKYQTEESKRREVKKWSEMRSKRKIKAEHKESEASEEYEEKTKNKFNANKITNVKEENTFKEHKTNNDLNALKQKSLSRREFFAIAGIEDKGKEWSKAEDEKLFKLSNTLNKDWKSISKFIQGRAQGSIYEHYINTLRWSAYEYKVDWDMKINKLSKLFPNHHELYVIDCISLNNHKLESFVPIALHLLNITQTVKNEIIDIENENFDVKVKNKEYLRKEKDENTINLLESKSDKFANSFMQRVEFGKVESNAIEKPKFKFISNQDESECSNCSESSGLNFLLKPK